MRNWNRHFGLIFALMATVAIHSQITCRHGFAAPPESGESKPNQQVGSSGILIFPFDRQIEQLLGTAVQHVNNGEFALAAGALLQVIHSPIDSFANGTGVGTSASARDRALQLSQRLPVEVRNRLEADLERIARDQWNPIKLNGNLDEISRFTSRHRSTPSGLEALQKLAAVSRDAGRTEIASIAYEQIVEHTRASRSQRTVALIAQISALVSIGRYDQARKVSVRHSELIGNGAMVTIGGNTVNADVWVSEQLSQAGASETSSALIALNDTATQTLRIPGFKPIWSHETAAFTDIQKTISASQRQHRDQGVASSLAVRPLIAGNVVMTRSLKDVAAYDLMSGEQLWTIPNLEHGWIIKRQGVPENNVQRPTIASWWHRRLEADSMFHSLSTDGQLVVLIQEQDRSNVEFLAPRQSGAQPIPTTGVRWNRLCGHAVSTGELRWQIGGPATGPADVFGGIAFQGTPLIVDDYLFEIVRRDDEIQLLALARDTGHLIWSVRLGVLPVQMADAASRRRIACPIELVNGLLICPTASGSVVAVDPIARSVVWTFRYPVLIHDAPIGLAAIQSWPTISDQWWNEWREVRCFATPAGKNANSRDGNSENRRNILVLATPDSNRLQAVEVETGNPTWSIPRSGGLHLVGIDEELAIVVEPSAIRAHDVSSGALRWRAETGEIAGLGTIVAHRLIQPRRSGGIAIVDLKSGIPSQLIFDQEFAPGTLVLGAAGWISQTEQSLMRLPFLDDMRRQALENWQTTNDASNALILAKLDLQAGDPIAARSRLRAIESGAGRPLLRQSLMAMLKLLQTTHLTTEVTGVDFAELSQELLSLCESDEDRLGAQRALGETALVLKDLPVAMNHCLDGLELIDIIGLRSLGNWTPDEISERNVRPDRILLGGIERILSAAIEMSRTDASKNQLSELDAILKKRFATARLSTDPFASQRLMDRLLPLEWGRRELVADPSAAFFARPLNKIEPVLLTAIGSHDRTTSARAAYHLAQLFVRSGWRTEAEAIERRILEEYPGLPVADGMPLAEKLVTDSSRTQSRQRLLSPWKSNDPWPNVVPRVEVISKQRLPNTQANIHQVPIRVHTLPGSLLDRLDVSIDRQGRKVFFAGDEHSRPWEIVLPNVPQPLRSIFASNDQVEAYGLGRLLVLRVGSEVFGIRPLNEHGEPNDSKRALTDLQLDMAPIDPPLQPQPIPGKVGIRHPSVRMIDGFGHPLGGLGPVRPGYLCYRSQARLVAVETATGRTLWERLDLPPNCVTFGDDERIYLWRTQEQSLQVLSAIDGRVIDERVWKASADDVLMQRDSKTWVISRHSTPQIELVDARDGLTIWARELPANAIPFVMDVDTIGIVDPSGLLHVLSAASGAPLGEALTIEVPQKVERIVSLCDGQRWYVAISGPVPRSPILQSEQVWGGLHMAFVHGWLYGIERNSIAMEWRRFIDSEPLPLQVSRNTPILVQAWRKSLGDPQNGIGIMRLIDKRTGRELFTFSDPSLQSYFCLLSEENHERLKVVTEREAIQLDFTPPKEESSREKAPKEK